MVCWYVISCSVLTRFPQWLDIIGLPFNDSANWRLAIAEHAQEILGDNLLGMQAGNEPDLYARYVLDG